MAVVVVTGVSSYTGACIARTVSERGHEVVGLCRRAAGAYGPLVQRRLAWAVGGGARLVFEVEAPSFPDWVTGQHVDVWVHHHHPMENFRSPGYDARAAEGEVLTSVPALTRALARSGAQLVVLSSTYFEPGEGGPSAHAPVTPYAALKARVRTELEAACQATELELSRVVIPAPTGALENADRLTPQLLLAAKRGAAFVLRSPDSVMDLIPGEVLAESYAELIEQGLQGAAGETRRPSGLVTSTAAWVARVEQELARPLGMLLRWEIPPVAQQGAPVRFENPESERVLVDWDEFFRRYARDWREE